MFICFFFFVTTFVRKPADLSHVLPSRFHSDCHSSQEVRQLSLLSDTTYCHGNESDVGHGTRIWSAGPCGLGWSGLKVAESGVLTNGNVAPVSRCLPASGRSELLFHVSERVWGQHEGWQPLLSFPGVNVTSWFHIYFVLLEFNQPMCGSAWTAVKMSTRLYHAVLHKGDVRLLNFCDCADSSAGNLHFHYTSSRLQRKYNRNVTHPWLPVSVSAAEYDQVILFCSAGCLGSWHHTEPFLKFGRKKSV